MLFRSATKTEGTVTTTTYAAGEGGAATEYVVDAAGGHGWPGAPERRMGTTPIMSFKGAERVWKFFEGKSRKVAPAGAPAKGSQAAGRDALTAPARAVQALEFPDLADPARKLPPARADATASASRRVPIKVHLPEIGRAHV